MATVETLEEIFSTTVWKLEDAHTYSTFPHCGYDTRRIGANKPRLRLRFEHGMYLDTLSSTHSLARYWQVLGNPHPYHVVQGDMLCDREYQGDLGLDGLLDGSCRLMSCNVDARSVRLENVHCLSTEPGLVLDMCF